MPRKWRESKRREVRLDDLTMTELHDLETGWSGPRFDCRWRTLADVREDWQTVRAEFLRDRSGWLARVRPSERRPSWAERAFGRA